MASPIIDAINIRYGIFTRPKTVRQRRLHQQSLTDRVMILSPATQEMLTIQYLMPQLLLLLWQPSARKKGVLNKVESKNDARGDGTDNGI